jgi:hypothetical protein
MQVADLRIEIFSFQIRDKNRFEMKLIMNLILRLTQQFIHSSLALQPFVGPWPLPQVRNLSYSVGTTPWTRDQPAARPLPTRRTTQT